MITELVLNHTSDQHPWFVEARSSRDNPQARLLRVERHRRQATAACASSSCDTETSNWAWDPISKSYYWHRFFSHQPDLNYDNPAVREEMWRVMKFWLDDGRGRVPGGRRAVPGRAGGDLVREPARDARGPEVAARAASTSTTRAQVLLAEANMWPEDVRPYFGDGDEFHMAFHFPMMPRMFMAVRLEDRKPLVDILERTPAIPDGCQWGIFLRNHDELTLEMVTDVERDYMYDELRAATPVARINLGIRRRLAPLLDGDRRRIELMNGLLMSLPGSPFLYYGDEIGMGDNIYLGDRNGVRTPMQWSGGWNGGFSTADPERLYLPLISNPIYGYQAVNVEAQRRTPALAAAAGCSGSSACAESHARLRPRDDRVPAARPTTASSPTSARSTARPILVVNNLAASAQAVELDLRALAGRHPDRDVRRQPVPAHRRAAVRADAGALRLLLVPAALALAERACRARRTRDGAFEHPVRRAAAPAHGGRPGGRRSSACRRSTTPPRSPASCRRCTSRPREALPARAHGPPQPRRRLDGRHARARAAAPASRTRRRRGSHGAAHARTASAPPTAACPGKAAASAPSSRPPTCCRRGPWC